MVKVRQDAWLEENDQLLAETVLRHVREGSTQLNAFEEAGDAMNRTAAACGFRWNAVVRKEYEKELAEAKKERKETMRALGKDFRRNNAGLYVVGNEGEGVSSAPLRLSNLSLDVVIAYLMRLQHSNPAGHETMKWQRNVAAAERRAEELEQEVKRLEKENQSIREDYDQFVRIMNRARKLVTLDGDEAQAPVFRMEPNGNLVNDEDNQHS
ncbi:RsfA family transcriptional regulator [Edaphobacillus lindanitolerans]|uniref:Prespore-specific regulator n=1 Tax=Edaphobacillus lindanitolerans TaxID=550447 RepID=A0A1U7PHV6_9BACI|nr:RsfA family transcriptional regulator [Edaphobacillus lindanitolerans]SIT70017.1 prespore-specific regulator [Edaphobacillus lindanitolerans]